MADRERDRTKRGWGILRKPGHQMDGQSAMLMIEPGRETVKAQFDPVTIDGRRNPYAFGWHCFPAGDFEIRRSG